MIMKVFLYILVLILPVILVCFLDYKLTNTKNKKSIIKLVVKDFFLINLLTPTFLGLIFKFKDLLIPNKQDYIYFLAFGLLSLVIGAIYLFVKQMINKYFELTKADYKNKYSVYSLYGLSVFLFAAGIFFITVTIWGKATYNDVLPDQIIVTIFSPMTGTDPSIIYGFIDQSLLVTTSFTYLFALLFYKRVNYKFKLKDLTFSEVSTRMTSLIISITIVLSGLLYGAYRFDLSTILRSYLTTSTYIDNNYVYPENVNISFPKEKRNLIHIYLESMENSYLDINHGGNMKENLIPNLYELSKEGYSFSNLEKGEKLGGPLTTYGATWSIASMVCQLFGVPMKVPAAKNCYGASGKFLPGAVGLGEIFHELGYNQSILNGADATFGGMRYLYEDHGGFKIIDHKYALDNNMLPSDDYSVNWGFEDEKLYEFAKQELTELASKDEPFYCIVENSDTHFPGFAFDGDQPDFNAGEKDVDYAKTIKFSDKMTVDFVRWIQEQPFYENTTVILIGDHLSMDARFFFENDFNNFTRTTYNLILNPSEELVIDENRLYNRKFSTYDYMPTILATIGAKIEGDILGLGRNLFSDVPTLFERDGYTYVNNEYVPKSKLYNKELINGVPHYDGHNLSTY